MKDFYVTLSSSRSKFSTRLAKPLQFSVPYQVGLVDIVFLKQDLERSFDLLSEDLRVLAHHPVPDTGKDLLKEINAAIAAAAPAGSREPSFVVDPDGLLRFRIGETKEGSKLYVNLSDPLSSDVRNYDIRTASAPDEAFEPTCCPWLGQNTFHCLFVYCDLVNRHLTGDSFQSLLRVVSIPFEVATGELCAQHYKYPLYLPVARSFIQDIKIELSEPFEEGFVVLILHFLPL